MKNDHIISSTPVVGSFTEFKIQVGALWSMPFAPELNWNGHWNQINHETHHNVGALITFDGGAPGPSLNWRDVVLCRVPSEWFDSLLEEVSLGHVGGLSFDWTDLTISEEGVKLGDLRLGNL